MGIFGDIGFVIADLTADLFRKAGHTSSGLPPTVTPETFVNPFWEGFKNIDENDRPAQAQVYKRFCDLCSENKLGNDLQGLARVHAYKEKIPDYDIRKHDQNLQWVLDYEKKEEDRTAENSRQYDEAQQQMERKQEELKKSLPVMLDNLHREINARIKDAVAHSENGLAVGSTATICRARNPKKLIADIVYLLTTTKLDDSHFHPRDIELDQYRDPRFKLQRYVYPDAPKIFRNLGIAADKEGADEAYLRPTQSKLNPVSLVSICFKDTPFEQTLMQPIPVSISDDKRFEHWHILAKTGHGKTQSLHSIIAQDLLRPEQPSLIIIEPKGDIVGPLSRLKIFETNPNRLSIIDPTKRPALNFFALPERIQNYSAETRSLLTGKIAEVFSQAIASSDAEISVPQRNALNNVVRLVFSMGGNIRHLLDILDDNPRKSKDASGYEQSPYREHIEKLGEWSIRFFRTQFYEGQFNISRKSLSSKLQNIIGSFPPFGDMFGAAENTLDLYQAMETPGSVVAINTNKGVLGEYASSLFGRLMVAQVMSAALQRDFLKSKKHPVFLIVDEAQDYFDESFQTILEQTRSANVGLTFAHHTVSQISRFRSIALGMPSIKLAAPESEDVDVMAAAMNTTTDLLTNLATGTFGLSVRGQQTAPVSIRFGALTKQPQMSDEAHRRLLSENARRFAGSPQINAPPPPKETPSAPTNNSPPPHDNRIELPPDD